MTLSFNRAIEHGALLDRALTETKAEGGIIAHAFLCTEATIIAIGGFDKDGVADLGARSGAQSWITPILVKRVDHTSDFYLALATLDDRNIVMRIVTSNRNGVGDDFPGNMDLVLIEPANNILNMLETTDLRTGSVATGHSADIKAINSSMLEGFIWSETVKKIKAEHDVDSVTLKIRPEILVEDTMAADDEDLLPVEFEYDLDEIPGTPFREALMVEYCDAKSSRKGKGLKLKDVCSLAKRATCLGEDAECSYDDYVFARATGRCKKCATQSSIRNKFKVN